MGAKFTLKDVVFEMYTCSEGRAVSASLPVQPIEKIGHVYTSVDVAIKSSKQL